MSHPPVQPGSINTRPWGSWEIVVEHTSCLLTPGEPRVVPPVSFFTCSSSNTFITVLKTFAFCRNSVCRIHVRHSLSTLFLKSEGGWGPGWKHMAPFTSRAAQLWAGWGLSNTRSLSGVITARGHGSYEGSYTWGGFFTTCLLLSLFSHHSWQLWRHLIYLPCSTDTLGGENTIRLKKVFHSVS